MNVSKNPPRRNYWGIATVIALVVLVIVAVWYWSRPKPIAVVLQQVGTGRVEASVANTRAGTVEACQRAKMAPPTGGQVALLPVSKGQQVKKGEVLLSLWNDDLKADVDLAKSEAGAAKAREEEACVLAEVADREAKRVLKLKNSALVSEERIDRAVSDATARASACRAARATTQESNERIKASRAALERTVLRAPFDGVVAEVNAKLGEFVTPSPPGIATLPAIDLIGRQCLYVTAPIDEVDAPAVRPGQPVRITLDAFPGKHFEGKVRRVAPYVLDREKQARTVEVEAAFSDLKQIEDLVPGYSADIEIILDTREGIVRVPTEAVLEGNRVLVYDPDSKTLQHRQFKPGLANWKYTQVVSGLERGDMIVVSVAREGVKAGAHVIPEATTEDNAPKQ